MINQPEVTIIVVPRERFRFAQESLESLYENTKFPFKLIYVDNNSPQKLQSYLKIKSQEKGFEIVSSNYYLSPNAARNLALPYVKTEYVVFVDNDVIFSPNWLDALIKCAKDTDATVVGSTVCQYKPVHETVHCVGGEYMSPEEITQFIVGEAALEANSEQKGKWEINEKTPYQNQKLAQVQDKLIRTQTGFIEFHSMLVKRSIFDKIGLLDEKFSCTKEYIDFAMSIVKNDGTIYLEPSSIVTFLTHPPAPALSWEDLPYFMLRWSDRWELDNLHHFHQKWNLVENEYFTKRYKKLGRRRKEELIKPLVKRFNFLGKPFKNWLESILVKLEKKLNNYLYYRYEKSLFNYQEKSPKKSISPINEEFTFFQ
ncbi:MAG: glycosyltransferase [Cyanobacteria bacterium P01_A01_bin.45]